MIAVRELEDEADAARWDAFVADRPEATFFHRAGWRSVIERAAGHRCRFLHAERAGRIVGVLPLAHVRSRLFGNALVALPFCVYGGPVAEDAAVHAALDDRAGALAETLGVRYLEYRGLDRIRPDWPCKDGVYATFRRPLDPDPERNLKAIPRKQRAVVRKALKSGLTTEFDDGAERFRRLYAESVRNHGTPVFPRRYFRALKETFGDACEILIVLHDGRPVAGCMTFRFRDIVMPYYAGGTTAARGVGAHDFMYWDIMRRGAESGARVFDFGRSKRGTGAFDFKKNWGFEPQALHYQYRLGTAREIPDLSPANPRYRLFIMMWKRLPLPVANLIGPHIARSLG